MDFGDLSPPDFTSVTQGIALAQRMRQQQAMTEMQEMNLQKQREEMERDRAYQQEFMRIMNNPQSTDQDLMRLAMMNPAQSKQMMQLLQMRKQQGDQADIRAIMQASVAAQNGDYETAMAIVDEAEQAAANSGRQSGIAGLGGIMRQNPALAGNLLRTHRLLLDPDGVYREQKAIDMENRAAVSGSNAFFQDGLNSEKVRKAQADADKAEIDAQNAIGRGAVLEAQANAYNARAQQANQAAGKAGGVVLPDGTTAVPVDDEEQAELMRWRDNVRMYYGDKIPARVSTKLQEMSVSNRELLADARELDLLRKEMNERDTGVFDAGAQGRAIEALKKFFGLSDDESLAIMNGRAKLTELLKNRRLPGPMSDRDVKLLMSGMPDPREVSPKVFAGWLERMSRLYQAKYEANSFAHTVAKYYRGDMDGIALFDSPRFKFNGKVVRIKRGDDIGRVIELVQDNAYRKQFGDTNLKELIASQGSDGAGGKYSAQHGSKWGQ